MSDPAPLGDPTRDLPHAFGGPAGTGGLRVEPEDFQVDEELGYGPSGSGEHVFLRLRKRNLNTHDLARRIARLAGVPQVAVGYAGLKDKRALASQAFTVQLAGRPEPDWTALQDADLQVLEAVRHHRKIRRGALRGNRFRLCVRAFAGDAAVLTERLAQAAACGVPNYFGPQRFGFAGNNLARARQLFDGRLRVQREQRSLLLSAVRSWLFNRVLAARVAGGTWDRALAGEVFQLDGTQRQFGPEPLDAALGKRLAELDIHPTGPLPGRASRALAPSGDAAAVEAAALRDQGSWIEGLQRAGLDADRRALRLRVRELTWALEGEDLALSFALDAGAYATAVLRELVDTGADQGDGRDLRDNNT